MNCCICNDFVAVSPVINHCHSTGKVLGIAHSNCNLRAQTKRILPVLFYNLSRFDAHHILKFLIVRPGEKFSAISRTDEVYISFSLRIKFYEYIWRDGRHVPLYSEVRFLDSFQFMSQSFESLAKTMQTRHYNCIETCFLTWAILIQKKIQGKTFFPYNYLDSHEKFSQLFLAYEDDWRDSFLWKNRHKWTRNWKRQRRFIHWCVATTLVTITIFIWLSMSISEQMSLNLSVVFVSKSITWTQFFFQLQTWVGKECWKPLKLNSVSSVLLTISYFVSKLFVVASMELMLWGTSKTTTSTWKTSINLSHLCLGLSSMSHHSMPERCNSLSHVAIINGETIWTSMTIWMQTASVAWGTSLKLIWSIFLICMTTTTICHSLPKNYKSKLNGYRTMPSFLELQHSELPSWWKLFSIKTSRFAILEI